MINYVQKGERIDYVNSSDSTINYGDVVAGKDRIYVAAEEIAVGATGAVYAQGVFEFLTADTSEIKFGEKLYYNTSSSKVTATSTDNIFAGYSAQAVAAASGTKTILVQLN